MFFFFKIWASSFFPNEPRIKDANQLKYFEKHNSPMLMDYVIKEIEKKVNWQLIYKRTLYNIYYIKNDQIIFLTMYVTIKMLNFTLMLII